MKNKKDPSYNENYVLKMKETLPLFDSKYREKVDLFLFESITLFPKKPTNVKFYYIPPKDSLSDFDKYSLRLEKDLIIKEIYQYNPGIDPSTNHTSYLHYKLFK